MARPTPATAAHFKALLEPLEALVGGTSRTSEVAIIAVHVEPAAELAPDADPAPAPAPPELALERALALAMAAINVFGGCAPARTTATVCCCQRRLILCYI